MKRFTLVGGVNGSPNIWYIEVCWPPLRGFGFSTLLTDTHRTVTRLSFGFGCVERSTPWEAVRSLDA